MSKEIAISAARLARDVPAAELRLDEALIAVSTLMTSAVAARRDVAGVPATKGQATIRRLMKAQIALVDASGDILRVHGALAEIGRETAGYDLHECPSVARAGTRAQGAAA